MEGKARIIKPTVDAELRPVSLADLATSVDHLGFAPYVRALERFLTNKETHGPLTISIEGEWGSGKSSFMKQLADKLEQSTNQPIIIRFNAWRHDRADELWAAFALEFMRQISKQQLTSWARWKAYWKLFWLRFKWGTGWRDVGRVIVWLGIVGASMFAGIHYGKDLVTKWFVAVAAMTAGLGTSVGWLAQRIGNPLEIDLKQHSKSPDYAQKISFLEQFHEDFVKILNAYAGNRRVFVFVDDLDRCEIPKAAELMQALNLMLSGENELFFLLGMDRQKVAAGIAFKHSLILPYLYAGESPGDPHWQGLQFGYEFIEKFIQIPFVLPRASAKATAAYIRSLSEVAPQLKEPEQPHDAERQDWIRESNRDSAEILRVAQRVVASFDNNPRRLKVFMNLFRLRLFIAGETGLFDEDGGLEIDEALDLHFGTSIPLQGAITIDQLGTFVALSLGWPLFLAEAERDQELISKLEEKDGDSLKPRPPEKWLKDRRLLQLLRGPESSRLGHVPVGRLLTVLPQVRQITTIHKLEFAESLGFSGSVSATGDTLASTGSVKMGTPTITSSSASNPPAAP